MLKFTNFLGTSYGFCKRTLETNKVFFETIFPVAFTLLGLMVVWQQNTLIGIQNEIADRDATLHDKEVRYVELQTNIARAELSPIWRFEYVPDEQIGTLTVIPEGSMPIRMGLDGVAVLAVKKAGQELKHIKLRGFLFRAHDGAAEHGKMFMFVNGPFQQLAHTNMLEVGLDGPPEGDTSEIPDDVGVELRFILGIEYYDRLNEKRSEFYQMAFPDRDEMPIAKEPQYDVTINCNDFIHDGTFDLTGLVTKVRQTVVELSK